MSNPLNYVLITPARNEAEFIDLTIRSIVAQTFRPLKWVIVSDGSTDQTDEIVNSYAAAIRGFSCSECRSAKSVISPARSMLSTLGTNIVKDLNFESSEILMPMSPLNPTYFEFLIGKMAENPRLGVAGAPFREGTFQYDYRYTNIDNVWGGCQLFRRECFEAIGGYMPLQGGGVDHSGGCDSPDARLADENISRAGLPSPPNHEFGYEQRPQVEVQVGSK